MDELLQKKLKTNPKNPRIASGDDFELTKHKIRDFPEMLAKRPIVYDSSDDYHVLGGNRRWDAVQALIKEGLVVRPEYFADCAEWTPEQKRKFVILDNVLDGHWNYDLLANEWSDLPLEQWGLDPTEWNKEKGNTKVKKETTVTCPNCAHEFKPVYDRSSKDSPEK